MKIYKKRDDESVNAAIEAMIDSMDDQEFSYVGIFWYDVDHQELFGVDKQPAEDRPFYKSPQFGTRVRTGRKLHSAIWKKEAMRRRDDRFFGDHTQVPRGRVFEFEGLGFVVFIGSWIHEHPEARDLILDEFDLPEDTGFRVDIHWELGHGWSDEF